MVSDVHANFFVNMGRATSRDVLSLIEVGSEPGSRGAAA